MSRNNIFRDGRVHVCRVMCSTCIFRPGNLMQLRDGRVAEMIEGAGEQGAIVCHDTLSGDNAACRGFYDQHRNQVLQIAQRLGFVKFV